MDPFESFFAVHLEVGGNTKSLEYQEAFWPAINNLVVLAQQHNVNLTLQLSPQWAEYILRVRNRLDVICRWQRQGHEVGLHHHGYDHGDWDGYTNRPGKESDPKFLGNIHDMMAIVRRLVYPYQICTGTITDEEFDYPLGIKHDTEGIQITHARSKPKWVILGGRKVVQLGMALLLCKEDIESLEREYLRSRKDEIFGVVTHGKDFAKNPAIIEEWFEFIRSRGKRVKTVKKIITMYQRKYPILYSDKPLKFSRSVMGCNHFI